MGNGIKWNYDSNDIESMAHTHKWKETPKNVLNEKKKKQSVSHCYVSSKVKFIYPKSTQKKNAIFNKLSKRETLSKGILTTKIACACVWACFLCSVLRRVTGAARRNIVVIADIF